MKILKPYQEDCFDFHKDIVKSKKNSKNDPTYKTRISHLNDEVKLQYQRFEEEFKNKRLNNINSNGYEDQKLSDLQKLYVYKSKKLQLLKKILTTDENNRVNNTCQNCTLSEVNSFDHYFPQSDYAEYVVNPHNLVPSCTICNSKKNDIVFADGIRAFINLYTDELPNVQFLFVDIIFSNRVDFNIEFRLENTNGIDPVFFEIIKSHYGRLDLLNRFKQSSDIIISELDTEIKKYSSNLSIEIIKQTVIEECEESYGLYGRNHWKYILKNALVEDDNFMERY